MGYFFRYDSICMKNWDLNFVGYEYWDYEMNLMRHWGLTNRNTTSHPDLETHGGMGGEILPWEDEYPLWWEHQHDYRGWSCVICWKTINRPSICKQNQQNLLMFSCYWTIRFLLWQFFLHMDTCWIFCWRSTKKILTLGQNARQCLFPWENNLWQLHFWGSSYFSPATVLVVGT